MIPDLRTFSLYSPLRYVVCCHHFRESDYRNKASNYLNTNAVPALNIPENERRTYRAEEFELTVSLNPPAPQKTVPPSDPTELFFELEEDDEKLVVLATSKADVRTPPESPEIPIVVPKPSHPLPQLRLESLSKVDIVSSILRDFSEDEEDDEDEELAEITEEADGCDIIEEMDESETEAQDSSRLNITDQELRDHYSQFSKEQLIEFLVKLQVYMK